MAGLQALALNIYPPSACNVPDGDQIEAIAQARAIAKFNLFNGLPGTGSRPGHLRTTTYGVSPDVQWEVTDRGATVGTKRADIVLYDSSQPNNTAVEIVEVKVEGNGSQVQASQQVQDTALAFRGAVHEFSTSGAYRDDFVVLRPAHDEDCSDNFIAVEHYASESLDDPNLDGVIWVSSEDIHCVPAGATRDPNIASEDDEQEPTGVETPVPAPPNNPGPPPGPGEKGFIDCLQDASGIAEGAASWLLDALSEAQGIPTEGFMGTGTAPS